MTRKEALWLIVQAAAPVLGRAAVEGLLGSLAQRIGRGLARWQGELPPVAPPRGRGLEP